MMMMSSLYFSFRLSLLFFLFSSALALSLHDDRPLLLAFKKLIISDPNQSLADWSPAAPLCNWTAVTCSRRHPTDRVVAIDLSFMDLSGPISPSLGNLSFLRSLDLSHNSLYGHIPPQLGRLFRLKKLRLSYNELAGSIPSELGRCRNLSYLALSYNNLSGIIPPELGSLTHLQQLYLTENRLIEHPRISYQELHIATNGFISANLLGTGSFGSVYRGILGDGTLIAVKVLQLQNDQAEKSFKVECNVLQNTRHRNLMRIITSCSNLHFKALVFKFMSNGSLEKHLYLDREDHNGDDDRELGIKTLLDIAIDVAHAIEYLHHDSFVQIVHCDIKPSNVLLDEDMVAHLADFGIAKLIGESSTNSLTSSFALKGTIGYIAPEYGLNDTVSTQGDVYSFGILLLEMITRKQPISDMFVGDLNLHKWVNLAFPTNLKEVIDNNLFNEMDGNECEENNIYKCLFSLLQIGLLCSKHSPQERPDMRDVVTNLKSIRADFMGNPGAPHGLRQTASNLLRNENFTNNGGSPSSDRSSTF